MSLFTSNNPILRLTVQARNWRAVICIEFMGQQPPHIDYFAGHADPAPIKNPGLKLLTFG